MITRQIRSFKEKLRKGTVKGPFSKTEDPGMVEAMGYAGFDFIILDMEHGPNTVRSLQGLIRAAQIAGIFPIIRIKENSFGLAAEVLDIGAGGIQVPQVTTAEEARAVIRAARYAPEGERGVCRFVRAADYSSADRFQYFKEANEAVIILQLEGNEAIQNLDDILEMEGIDVLFIGPYDLSQSLGVAGKIDHPKVVKAMEHIVQKCNEKMVATGTFVDTISNAHRWQQAGVKYIAYSVDTGLMYEKCKEIIKAIS
ncbi:HpcH/HpaI aldolase family protein [Petrimonas sp.]|uniref:HpcH/HpaI aldolase family protein n=1 Tax=Petrimonas sp. TaxID=2023866 RepID=UPI002FCB9961|nr:aldolase/citrate lyase family protein [Prolixibacteraceae bacterium]